MTRPNIVIITILSTILAACTGGHPDTGPDAGPVIPVIAPLAEIVYTGPSTRIHGIVTITIDGNESPSIALDVITPDPYPFNGPSPTTVLATAVSDRDLDVRAHYDLVDQGNRFPFTGNLVAGQSAEVGDGTIALRRR